MSRSSVLALAACSMLASACDTSDTGPPELRLLTAAELQVVNADNAFGLHLYRALTAESPQVNLFFSPASVAFALGMTANGAAGETQEQMLEALVPTGMDLPAYNEASSALMAFLPNIDPLVQTAIANSIWYDQVLEPEQAFLETNAAYFDAEVAPLDFHAPASVDVINRWVEEETNGKIERLIDRIPPDAVMYLINAIYFKGSWAYRFNESDTRDEPFHNRVGEPTPVPMMRMKATIPHQTTTDFAAIDLPYGAGQYRMTVILPHTTEAIDSLITTLDSDRWRELTDSFANQEINVILPRFSVTYEKELNAALKALGIADAFDRRVSNFSCISAIHGEDLYISRVLHKAVVEVNEEGAEAAAATAVEIELRSSGGSGETFRADRPFIFAIREAHSGAILFIGTLNTL